MCGEVLLEVIFASKALAAHGARMWLASSMAGLQVPLNVILSTEAPAAHGARMRLVSSVGGQVLREPVSSAEASLAHAARVLDVAGSVRQPLMPPSVVLSAESRATHLAEMAAASSSLVGVQVALEMVPS